MLKAIAIVVGIGLVAVIAGILIYAATKPDAFRVQRATVIQAPPDAIYPLIVDLHGWTAWSPYEKKDPAMKRNFSGATSGPGAVYEWDGNKDVGKGRMEIIEATPPSKILIKLDFLAPFEAHNTAEFALQPAGGATTVTWAIYGPQPFISKVMSLFFNFDRMIGDDFEAGLASLKAQAERAAPPAIP